MEWYPVRFPGWTLIFEIFYLEQCFPYPKSLEFNSPKKNFARRQNGDISAPEARIQKLKETRYPYFLKIRVPCFLQFFDSGLTGRDIVIFYSQKQQKNFGLGGSRSADPRIMSLMHQPLGYAVLGMKFFKFDYIQSQNGDISAREARIQKLKETRYPYFLKIRQPCFLQFFDSGLTGRDIAIFFPRSNKNICHKTSQIEIPPLYKNSKDL